MKILLYLLVEVLLIVILNSCAMVKPYQREYLADRIMNFESNIDEIRMERHFLETREGSSGGQGGAGGGCACN